MCEIGKCDEEKCKSPNTAVADGHGEGIIMTIEEQVKILSKWIIENSNRQFTQGEKEAIKQAINEARTPAELVAVAVTARLL